LAGCPGVLGTIIVQTSTGTPGAGSKTRRMKPRPRNPRLVVMSDAARKVDRNRTACPGRRMPSFCHTQSSPDGADAVASTRPPDAARHP